MKNIRFGKITYYIVTTFLIMVFGFNFFGVASAQTRTNSNTAADGNANTANCYTIKLSLLKNGNYTADTNVKASAVANYSLSVNIVTSEASIGGGNNTCDSTGTFSLKYDIYDDATGSHSTPVKTGYFDQNTRIDGKDFGKNYSLTDPALVTYTYTLTWSGGLRSPLSTSINVTFTDDKGKTNPGSTGTGGNPANANTPPNLSKNNNQINTGISANFQGSLDDTLGTFFNPLNAKSIPELITNIIRVLFLLISILAIIMIIVSGFRMVLASGNEEQLTKAKKAITWAIIGLIVSLMSFSIVAIIQNLISRQ